MNASETYYKQEESKKFQDWTKGGLEFLLKSRTDILTSSQIALVEKKLTKLYLEEKRKVPADCTMIPMATL